MLYYAACLVKSDSFDIMPLPGQHVGEVEGGEGGC
jgi:hypothetical protein